MTMLKDASDEWLQGAAEALSDAYNRAIQVQDKPCILVTLEHQMASVSSERRTRASRREAQHAEAVRRVHECEAKLAALDAETKPKAPAAVTMCDMVNLFARLEARIATLETMPCGCSRFDDTCLAGSMEACEKRQRETRR